MHASLQAVHLLSMQYIDDKLYQDAVACVQDFVHSISGIDCSVHTGINGQWLGSAIFTHEAVVSLMICIGDTM